MLVQITEVEKKWRRLKKWARWAETIWAEVCNVDAQRRHLAAEGNGMPNKEGKHTIALGKVSLTNDFKFNLDQKNSKSLQFRFVDQDYGSKLESFVFVKGLFYGLSRIR